MTPFEQLQAQKIISCYNNSQIADRNISDVAELHIDIESVETPGYQELEDEKIVTDFDEDNEVEKGGEGSRGGKIIGHTRSGKPIYGKRSDHKGGYDDWTEDDHKDAAQKISQKYKLKDEDFYAHHSKLTPGKRAARHYVGTHEYHAGEKAVKEHNGKYYKKQNDGKYYEVSREVGDKTKKQIEQFIKDNPSSQHHHPEYANTHSDMIKRHREAADKLSHEPLSDDNLKKSQYNDSDIEKGGPGSSNHAKAKFHLDKYNEAKDKLYKLQENEKQLKDDELFTEKHEKLVPHDEVKQHLADMKHHREQFSKYVD